VFDTHKITKSMGTGRKGQADSSLQAGATLQNRYLIEGVLGVGGMGSVYRARDMRFPNVKKIVAVKEILNLVGDPSMREMIIKTFEREANTLATLDHPAIPKIYDYFNQGDRSFLVQEFIEGKDLENYLNETPGMLGEDLVVEWALQLCDVLWYLHSHQPEPIIFRDMKPSNVMLDHHSRIRLIDFGIARPFTAGQKGTMIGTEGYSPPEQYRGEASPAGDIYALGATLHHLLTKQDPRIEPPFSFAERPIRKTNPAITAEFEAIINTALNYTPADRFTNAKAMKEALLSLRKARTGILTGRMPSSMTPTTGTGTMPIASPPNLLHQSTQAAVSSATPSAGAVAVPAKSGAPTLTEVAPVWSFRSEDELRGSPTHANGVIYIGAYDNNLYAVNAADGKLLWKYATDGGLPGWPTVHQDQVFIGSEDRRVHVISAKTGKMQWTYYTDGPVRSSPRISENHLFVGSDDGHLHAVNITNGRRAWKSQATGPVRCRPALAQERLYFGCETGDFYCLDFSGEQKWRFKAKRGITASPLYFNGTVYVGSQDGMIYALDASSGWRLWQARTNKPIISSPAVDGHQLVIGSADNQLYCIDVRTGREMWKYETEGQVTSSPAINKGIVYVGSVDGNVYAMDLSTGKPRWRFRSGGPITSSPIVVNDIVYIGSNDHSLYALPA
jgi:outer membrane protein assembly factor BamB